MKTQQEILSEIKLVTRYPLCINWFDFTNHRWKCDPGPEEHHMIAEVRIALPKTDPRYLPLMQIISAELKAKWVTYDKLTQYLGRLISLGDNHQDFIRMMGRSVTIRISQRLPVR